MPTFATSDSTEIVDEDWGTGQPVAYSDGCRTSLVR